MTSFYYKGQSLYSYCKQNGLSSYKCRRLCQEKGYTPEEAVEAVKNWTLKKNAHHVTYVIDGNKSLKCWCDDNGVPYNIVYWRVKFKNETLEEAIKYAKEKYKRRGILLRKV